MNQINRAWQAVVWPGSVGGGVVQSLQLLPQGFMVTEAPAGG